MNEILQTIYWLSTPQFIHLDERVTAKELYQITTLEDLNLCKIDKWVIGLN